MGLPWWLSGKRILLPMQEMWVQSLGQEDTVEKEMATYSNILTWEIPWTEEPGRLQSMGVTKNQTRPCDQTTTKDTLVSENWL